jgi:hypothetical protein
MPKFKHIIKRYMPEAEIDDNKMAAMAAAAKQAVASSEEPTAETPSDEVAPPASEEAAVEAPPAEEPPAEEPADMGTEAPVEEQPVEEPTSEEEVAQPEEEPTSEEEVASEEPTSSEEDDSNKTDDELNQEMTDLERRISYWETIYKEIPEHQMYLPTPELRKKADAARAIFHDVWDVLQKRIKELEKKVSGAGKTEE